MPDGFRDLAALAMGAEMYPREFLAGVEKRACSNTELFLFYAISYLLQGDEKFGRPLEFRTEGTVVWAQVGRNSTHQFYLGIDPEANVLYKYSEGENGYDANGYVTWIKSAPYVVEGDHLGYIGHW